MNKEIEALLIERKGYLMRGLAKRVADVDASLAVLGYYESAPKAKEIASVEPEVERSIKPKVKRRKV